VAKYDIHRSTTAGFTPSAANKVGETTTSSFHDTGVAAGTYHYMVIAEDAAGNLGPPSNEAAATVTSDSAPPSTPTGLTATGASRAVNLSWTGSTDDVGVAGYRIYRDGSAVGTTTQTTYGDTGLAVATSYTYTVTAFDASGGESLHSNPASATTAAGVPVALDRLVTTHGDRNATTLVSPPLSTTKPGELLVAFLASDGPNRVAGQSFSSVTGGGLTWTLRQRTNAQAGTAEIWQAVAPAPLSNVTITATRSGGSYTGAMTVAAFDGADTSALGAVGTGNAATGAPAATLTTTRNDSWVWGAGTDWDKATPRTLGAGQTLVDEFGSPSGDDFWVQRRTSLTPAAGTAVTINDTAPAIDRWDLSLIEILSAAPGPGS
jgi:hypothetical protein